MKKDFQLKFGPAGMPDAFYEYSKNKLKIFEWLHSLGLDAMEYQAVYGVRTAEPKARQYGELARENGITLSVHGPYYVSLASVDLDVRARSVERLKNALRLAKWLGSSRVIFHPAYFKGEREEGLEIVINGLKKVEKETDVEGVYIYPETGGKVKALGSTEELITICKEVSICRPCIDFAHEHARGHGSLNIQADFDAVLAKLSKGLGKRILDDLHIHYSQIIYTQAGERAHAEFNQKDESGKTFKPDFRKMIKSLIAKKMPAVIISECKNTQATGAVGMMNFYKKNLKRSVK